MSLVDPATPADVLRTSLRTRAAVKCATLFGLWDRPLQNVATNLEEMKFADLAYWFYKSARPIERSEKNVRDILFLHDKSALKLPDEFRRVASITLSASGDLIRADGLEYSKDFLFESVSDVLFDADISLANYESPVADDKIIRKAIGDGSSLMMCCSFDQYAALTEHRGKHFTLLNVANNHILDLGVEGLETTRSHMGQSGIIDIGAPRFPDEYGRARILTKKRVKVGFISATFGLNGYQLPQNERYRVHAAKLLSKYVATDLELLQKQIQDCKKQHCEFIIASIHWGYEFEFFPRYRQVEAAHSLIEEGVDLIVGHHPHVIQPLEYYRTKRDPNRIGVIAYSLGSLIWGWYTAPHLVLSMVLNVKLAKGIANGVPRTYIETINVHPVFRDISYHGKKRLMRIEKLYDHSDSCTSAYPAARIRTMQRYVDLVLGSTTVARQSG
ncbi:CapA family protein [Bradyrhizobium yuanmingense]|uniref:CapA family protein n=1 Tax=Bradyrhizobium yuanmingense TaxID=108015 RepID=UPI0023B969F0|nr:CapA family protein [Bradyrhizobium yuanmingense]MDF0498426.1 CapA family protein [Bradyrhizobium yuanmingense]